MERALRLAASLLLGTALGTPGLAQAVPDSIPAPRDLRDFRIQPDGTIAPPPAPAPAPAPAPVPTPETSPPPAEPSPPPGDAAAPGSVVPPPRDTVGRFPRTRPVSRPAPARAAPPPAAGTITETPPAPVPAPVAEPLGAPPAVPPTVSEPTANAPASAAAEAPARDVWPWLLGGGILAALAGLFLWRRRRVAPAFSLADDSHDEGDVEPGPIAEETAAPLLTTAAAKELPAAVPLSRLELTFSPSSASATDARAAVDFLLTVTNAGHASVRRVRMEARMFAMGSNHDAALAEFFAGPLARPTPIASAIPPGIAADMRAQVSLPRDAVHPIRHADRVLFVPLVAFNVLYEYDDGAVTATGQATMSYVVGRENRPPAAKMAPFRLDQGPKVYREVGQRVHQLRDVA